MTLDQFTRLEPEIEQETDSIVSKICSSFLEDLPQKDGEVDYEACGALILKKVIERGKKIGAIVGDIAQGDADKIGATAVLYFGKLLREKGDQSPIFNSFTGRMMKGAIMSTSVPEWFGSFITKNLFKEEQNGSDNNNSGN